MINKPKTNRVNIDATYTEPAYKAIVTSKRFNLEGTVVKVQFSSLDSSSFDFSYMIDSGDFNNLVSLAANAGSETPVFLDVQVEIEGDLFLFEDCFIESYRESWHGLKHIITKMSVISPWLASMATDRSINRLAERLKRNLK